MTEATYNTRVLLDEDGLSYYLLGLYITDGNVYVKKKVGSISIELKSIDLDLLEEIRDLICPARKITPSHNRCFRLRFHNKVIGQWLINKGCVPNKTKVVKFPDVPEQFLPDFVRGLLDGDGSIGIYDSNRRGMIRFDSASYDLIVGVQDCLSKWGIKCSIGKTAWIESEIDGHLIHSTTQMYRIALTGLKAYKLLKIIYRDGGLSLRRKKDMGQQIIAALENNPFTESELLSMDRIPSSNRKWLPDEELVALVLAHKGCLKTAAEEVGSSAWGLSSRLRRMGRYDYIRSIYPIDNLKNLGAHDKRANL